VLACDYVVDVERQRIDADRKMTVLASAPGALPYLPGNVAGHRS